MILIRQAGRFFVDADDASHVRAKGMPPRQALQSSLLRLSSALPRCEDLRSGWELGAPKRKPLEPMPAPRGPLRALAPGRPV